jgi:hypothetical protein
MVYFVQPLQPAQNLTYPPLECVEVMLEFVVNFHQHLYIEITSAAAGVFSFVFLR